ncbi:unnamed protein product [Camellia sinensis]
MAESATTEASETLIEAEPSTQDMDLEIPIAATEEQLPAADSKRSREDSGEDSSGAKKLKVENSAEEDRLDQLEGTEGDKESDRVSVGPKNFGSSVEMFDYFYKFLHYWPPNVNVNKGSKFCSKHSIEIQAETLASFALSVGQTSVATISSARVHYILGGVARNVAECMSKLRTKPYMISAVGFDMAGFLVFEDIENGTLKAHLNDPLKTPLNWRTRLQIVIGVAAALRVLCLKLLIVNPPKGWPHVQRLSVDLFKFMEPYLHNAELGETIHFLYKGTLRVLLVLLHDFPEFLCDYRFSFCDVIPSSCIQMRNVIRSAFPHNMRLPDPSTPNLKIDLFVEINQSPQIFSEVDAALKAKQMKSDVDEYLKWQKTSKKQ